MQIIELFQTPDDKEFYFTPEHQGKEDLTNDNEEAYNLWKENKDKFIEKANNWYTVNMVGNPE